MISVFQDDYIGIKGLVDDPVSGLFINSLPGISTRNIEAINDDKYQALLDFWHELYDAALREFEVDLKLSLNKYFARYSEIGRATTGGRYTRNALVNSADYIGRVFDLTKLSRNVHFVVNDLSIYLTAAGDVTVKGFDLDTGAEIYSKTFPEVPVGANVLRIDKPLPAYKYNQVFFAVDAETVAVSTLSNSNDYYQNRALPKGSPAIAANLVASNSVIVNFAYTLECSIDKFVYDRRDIFAMPFMYKLGLQVVNERKHSDRLNRFTLIDMEHIDDLLSTLEEKYEKAFSASLKDIKIQSDNVCFVCNSQYRRAVKLP